MADPKLCKWRAAFNEKNFHPLRASTARWWYKLIILNKFKSIFSDLIPFKLPTDYRQLINNQPQYMDADIKADHIVAISYLYLTLVHSQNGVDR